MTTSSGGTTASPSPLKVFFTSDTHFYHTNIIRYCARPFASIEEMNRVMIERWNTRVGPKDIVYHLGDFAFGVDFKKAWVKEKLTKVVKQLNGYKILVRGNHDKGEEYMRALGFDEVHDEFYINTPGQTIYLHHQPVFNWRDELFKASDFHFCGHVHEKWARQGDIINVGVDQSNFMPLTVPELIAREWP